MIKVNGDNELGIKIETNELKLMLDSIISLISVKRSWTKADLIRMIKRYEPRN